MRPAATLNADTGAPRLPRPRSRRRRTDEDETTTDDEQALTRTIGQRLRALRQGRELSLQQLAERTDGAPSTSRISNYEQGIRRFSVATALVLADALTGVSAAYLLCLDRGGATARQGRM